MPSGHNPRPCINDSAIEQRNYFGRQNAPSPPPGGTYNTPHAPKTRTPSRNNSIPRKPVPSRRQQNGSSDTILRHTTVPGSTSPPDIKNHALSEQINCAEGNSRAMRTLAITTPPSPQACHFLGRIARLALPGGSRIREAIAISYL
jgi:hypothetical protein